MGNSDPDREARRIDSLLELCFKRIFSILQNKTSLHRLLELLLVISNSYTNTYFDSLAYEQYGRNIMRRHMLWYMLSTLLPLHHLRMPNLLLVSCFHLFIQQITVYMYLVFWYIVTSTCFNILDQESITLGNSNLDFYFRESSPPWRSARSTNTHICKQAGWFTCSYLECFVYYIAITF